MTPSERLQWAAEQVAAGPDERLLEVGCGHGVAVGLVAATLTTGHVTGLDRSAKMIEIAQRTNTAHIEAGRAAFVTGSVEGASLPPASFDVVFAVRVAAFWTRAARVLPMVRRLLTPRGRLLVMFDAPASAAGTRGLVESALIGHGFRVDDIHHGHGTCVIARPC